MQSNDKRNKNFVFNEKSLLVRNVICKKKELVKCIVLYIYINQTNQNFVTTCDPYFHLQR